MKILCLPDSHGSPVPYETAVSKIDAFDRIIFLGDYFDHCSAKDLEFEDQKENFLNIINLKKNNPEKVNVFIGNHEICYLIDDRLHEQEKYASEIKNLIETNIQLLDFAAIEDSWLFSHAGFCLSWMHIMKKADETVSDMIAGLNKSLHEKKYDQLGICGLEIGDGWNPLEVRIKNLKETAGYINFNQVVGHTEISGSKRIFELSNGFKLIDLDSPGRNVSGEIDTDKNTVKIVKSKNNQNLFQSELHSNCTEI